ncbi:hypothetical protein [Pedobacter cryoconitis]|uniref:Uncharacterized protein n=1 Tax=Pedobacter cryoconitis TaxID=188932 RepID=A0A327ST88_9SPHI|nr:hypothetical protein [Pedobacter cryoconitis]RAJ28867.1 hypothetical protein LY11_03141 [Pedobacter cryoconitis]
MNNGRITIELAGVRTPLTFGMLAVEEFGNRQAIGNTGWSKLITDLVYSGYCNEEVVSGRNPALTYRDIAESLDQLIIDKDTILSDVFACFENSKAGAELLGVVKKKEEPVKPKRTLKKQTGTK